MIYVGPCHQVDETIVYLPKEGVVFAGDVVFRQCTPMGKTGFYEKWFKCLDLITELAPAVVDEAVAGMKKVRSVPVKFGKMLLGLHMAIEDLCPCFTSYKQRKSMNWIKRLSGVVFLLFGAVGAIAGIVGIIAVWSLCGRVDETVVRVGDRMDEILGRVNERSEKVADRISSSRESLNELNRRVQRRVAEIQDVPESEAADIDEIERQVRARIERIRDLTEFLQSSAVLFQQIFEMLESSSVFLKSDKHNLEDTVKAIRAGHQEVEQAEVLFVEMNEHLVEIQAMRNIDEHAKEITSLYERIEKSLGKVQVYSTSFDSSVIQLRKDVSNDVHQVQRWLRFSGVFLTLVLIWISVAQISLAIHGWALVSPKPSKANDAVSRTFQKPDQGTENA